MSNEEGLLVDEEEALKKRFLRRRKRNMIFGVVFLLVVCGYFFWQFLKQPAQGTVHVTEQKEGNGIEKKQKLRLYQGKYINFLLRDVYVERSHVTEAKGPIQESILLSTTDVEGRKIALTVADRGTSDLSADPSFQIRMDPREKYERRSFSAGLFQGILFQNNAELSEVTVFLTHEGKILSISVTSPFGKDDLEEELIILVQSLHFTME